MPRSSNTSSGFAAHVGRRLQELAEDQRSVRINFNNDPQGHRGFSGLYHEQCGKPFASLARVLNLNWFGRF